ncbi:MAG: hypothetical protein N2316_04830 [Spirochaetes bacterium]|nr:hypothetical protein [Spirochaetota bacterium]
MNEQINSIILFYVVGFSQSTEFSTFEDRYTLNDLITIVLFTIGFIYILDRIRYTSWQKSKQIEAQNQRIQSEKERIENIITQTKKVVE